MIDTNPRIYSDSIGDVYIYDFGFTVEVLHWGGQGRNMFYRKQGRDSPWMVVRNVNGVEQLEHAPEGPPWPFPSCPTLSTTTGDL